MAGWQCMKNAEQNHLPVKIINHISTSYHKRTTIHQNHRLELDGKNDTMPEQNHLAAAENKALKIQIEEQNRTMLDQKRLAEAEIQTLNAEIQALHEQIEDQNHTMICQRRLDEVEIHAMNGQIEDQAHIMRAQICAIQDDMQIIADQQRQINFQADQIRVLLDPLHRAYDQTGLFVNSND